MKPLQVYLEESDLQRLDDWSRERGWTKSQAIRAAVRALTQGPAEDPVLSLSGMVHGLPTDCSENFDRYLNATFVAETPARYGRQTRRSKPRIRR
jgi:hypothetical protein